jgi:hypothetical protein
LDENLNIVNKSTKALLVASKEAGLQENAEKLSASPCLVARLMDKIIILRLLVMPLKHSKDSVIGGNGNRSELLSEEN